MHEQKTELTFSEKLERNQFMLFFFLRTRIFMKVFYSHKYKEAVIFPSRCWNGAIELEESDFHVHTPLTCTWDLNRRTLRTKVMWATRTELTWSSIGGDREGCHCGGPGWGGSYSQVVLGHCLSPHPLSTSNFSLHTIFRPLLQPVRFDTSSTLKTWGL